MGVPFHHDEKAVEVAGRSDMYPLGIFDINMPMLYGEESRAFIRLQEEIMKTSADQSILMWQLPPRIVDSVSYMTGILADSPSWFSECSTVKSVLAGEHSYTLTNLGLNIRLSLAPIQTPFGRINAARLIEQDLTELKSESQMFLMQIDTNRFVRFHYDQPILSQSYQEYRVNVLQRSGDLVIKQPTAALGFLVSDSIAFGGVDSLLIFCEDPSRRSVMSDHPTQFNSRKKIHSIVAPFSRKVGPKHMTLVVIALSLRLNHRVMVLHFARRSPSNSPEDSCIYFRCFYRTKEDFFGSESKHRGISASARYKLLDEIEHVLPIRPEDFPNEQESAETRSKNDFSILPVDGTQIKLHNQAWSSNSNLGLTCRPRVLDRRLFLMLDFAGTLPIVFRLQDECYGNG